LKILIIILIAMIHSVSFSKKAFAGDFVEDQPGSQSDSTDSSFDPFSDYSEFEEGSEEESDVNFFHNGRFLSLGIFGGYETFTDTYGQLYKPNFAYGVFISYFFDLRFAMQVGYGLSSHSMDIFVGTGANAQEITGTAAMQHFEFDVKYFFNTQNVTKGLGWINPYLIIGVSNYTRTLNYSTVQGFARDTAFGAQGGLGVEIPIMKSRMFIGAQGLYNYISFGDRGSQLQLSTGQTTGITLNGDAITALGIIGFNF
jgi:hypothetical protein